MLFMQIARLYCLVILICEQNCMSYDSYFLVPIYKGYADINQSSFFRLVLKNSLFKAKLWTLEMQN